ncbi:MAG TPA: methyltransferase domain-containing protein [Bacteroidia bacterium]|jgi:thiopurine S-methyltransferase
MQEFDNKYWTERYINDDAPWDAGTITTPLKEYIDQLEDKKISILIPGAGNAYEAECFFNKGFKQVSVIDLSKEPLANLKQRLPEFPEENLIHGNFFDHHKTYDLIIEQTFFCAIDPSLRQRYAEKMHSLLNPGGKLAGVLFNDKLNNDKPPFGGSREEYVTYFEKYFELKTVEPCYNSIKPREGRELFVILIKK